MIDFVFITYYLLFFIRERQLQQKANRKLEKKIKDIVMQLDDERRTVDQYKEQVEKVCILNIIIKKKMNKK